MTGFADRLEIGPGPEERTIALMLANVVDVQVLRDVTTEGARIGLFDTDHTTEA
jgi:hypothetical protein